MSLDHAYRTILSMTAARHVDVVQESFSDALHGCWIIAGVFANINKRESRFNTGPAVGECQKLGHGLTARLILVRWKNSVVLTKWNVRYRDYRVGLALMESCW